MKTISFLFSLLMATNLFAQQIIDFEKIQLKPDTFWDGSDKSAKGFLIDEVWFPTNWDSYLLSGFASSTMRDTLVKDYTNQYSVATGSGFQGSSTYLVAYNPGYFKLNGSLSGRELAGAYLCNSIYTLNTILIGNSFSEKFGGDDGKKPDYFRVIFKGFRNQKPSKDSVIFYLADFRSENNLEDYILKNWAWVDFSPLGNVDSVSYYFQSSDTGIYGVNTPSYFCMDNLTISGIKKFAPGVGKPGTSAMHKDSSAFISWASFARVFRGMKKFGVDSLGKADAGLPEYATGKAGVNGIVSLGDGGEAILEFPNPIKDGPSWDFAVFENSFNGSFLELAFVEVSSDGKNFFRFPAESLTDTNMISNGFDVLFPENLNNLAGKYPAGFGTPFDLNEMTGIAGLNIDNITHVKLIDVIGAADPTFCTRDIKGRKVRDPWPTPFSSSGFDLDAVGVIHQAPTSISENLSVDQPTLLIFPQPATDMLKVRLTGFAGKKPLDYTLCSLTGQVLKSGKMFPETELNFSLENMERGIYLIRLNSDDKNLSGRFLVE